MAETRNTRKRQSQMEHELELKKNILGEDRMECFVSLGPKTDDETTAQTSSGSRISNNEQPANTIENIGESNMDEAAIKLKRGMAVNFEWVPSGRKNFEVLYSIDEKQRYKKNKPSKNYVGMTCCVDKCPARLFLYENGKCVYSDKFVGHSHTTVFESTVEDHQFKKKLRTECSKLETVGGKLPSVRDIYMQQSDE